MIKNFTSLLCLILVLAASSCKKIDETPVNRSYLSIINASSSRGTFNFYLNNVKTNTAALPMGGIINYLELPPGSYPIKFTTASSTESLVSKTVELNENSIYSYYLVGRTGQLEIVSSTDLMTAGNDQASVRIANMSPDAPSLNLVTTTMVDDEAASEVVLNTLYKGVSDFVKLAPKAYTFEVRNRETGATIATLPSTTIVAGKYYTLLVRGMINPEDTENPVGVQLITSL